MIPSEEDNFPRGNRKVDFSRKRPKHDDNLFTAEKKSKAKKPRKDRKNQKDDFKDDTVFSSLMVKGSLTYNKIQTGMVVLGCVRNITEFSLELELPGLTFGYVNIVNISDPFTRYLNNKLQDKDSDNESSLKKVFTVGQFLAFKVTNIEMRKKGIHVEGTINPREINDEKTHVSFNKGDLVWAAVQSVLDHGYEINIGVKNCRVFLPSKNIDEGRTLVIGEPLWCTVHKSDIMNTATTLRVSTKEAHLKSVKLEEVASLDDVLPGSQIEFVTEKITLYGIQGKFLNNFFGYVDESQLKNPLDKLEEYQEGKLLTAFVLYTEPITKITHLTLRNLDAVGPPEFLNGDIISAVVISQANNGIYLKTSSSEKCLVTNKRLIESLPKKDNISVTKSIAAKYPLGSKQTCRIMDYSRMKRLYVCSVDQNVIKEKYFNSKDVQCGQLLEVKVKEVTPKGLVVSSGHINGFVPNLHLSDVKYSENVKKKFKEGSKLKARILSISDENILMTLKPSLVESEKCLLSYKDAKQGDSYSGVVVHLNDEGILVVFYGNIKGWITKRDLNYDDPSQRDNHPSEYFFIGQIVNTWVKTIEKDKLTLSLKPPKGHIENENTAFKIGQKINGFVGKIYKDRIAVKSAKSGGKVIGNIPVYHLSCVPILCLPILSTFKPGDEIKDLMCINNKSVPKLLSRRETQAQGFCKKFKLKKFSNLKSGQLLRCSFIEERDSRIVVAPLILDYTEHVIIEKNDIVNNTTEALPEFKSYESIVAKILHLDRETNSLRLTLKLKEVFDKSVETVVNLFSQQLSDIKYLRDFGEENNWDICAYKPGERVLCKVEKIDGNQGGCLVSLPNKARGLVPPVLCPKNIKLGETFDGVFLSQDFKDKYVEVVLKKDLSQKINRIQDGNVTKSSLSSCIAECVIVKTDYVLCLLKEDGYNRQLVYVPLYLHENDRLGTKDLYKKGKIKICICGKVGPYLIGMCKKLFMSLDKQKLKNVKLQALRDAKQKLGNGKSKGVIKEEEDNDTVDDEFKIEEIEDEYSELDDVENEILENKEINDNEDEINEKEDVGLSEQENNIDSDNSSEENIMEIRNQRRLAGTKRKTGEKQDSDPVLPGVLSFFKQNFKSSEEESSSDEDTESEVVKKKKKLSASERSKLARLEEERISQIEKEFADSTNTPRNAEHFDRLLVAKPNSSELWAQYMSFHVAATEFDKARTVAKRALESINMTLTEERLNIWIALLNLENIFGTKESFDKTFEEALKCNDSLQIYLKVIGMLGEAGKLAEMEEKIHKVKNKHKQEPTMWLEVAKVYYMLNKYREARNFKDASLKSIQDKKTQMNLVVRFAIMEFKYGEEEHGAAIFETILSSDPRKVNIWTTYVDQLIKKGNIEQARKVLERSICQKLPIKSIKTLFMKFRMFEEQHGTPELVEAVKERAKEFVTQRAEK